MKYLKQRIISLRAEIKALKYERNAKQREIDKKEDVLEELEKLTVNQLDMFPDAKSPMQTLRKLMQKVWQSRLC